MRMDELIWDRSTHPDQRWAWQVGGTPMNIVQTGYNRYTLFTNDPPGKRPYWDLDAIELQCLLFELFPTLEVTP